MLAVTGARTTIVAELKELLPLEEEVVRIPMDTTRIDAPLQIPKAQRFVLAAGMLHGKQLAYYTPEELQQMVACNMVNPMRICEWVLSTNPTARICIIGSESARRGSFDKVYSAAKAGIHEYVQHRHVAPQQQLVVVSPPIIRDSGMTSRRPDLEHIVSTRVTCTAAEVARIVYRLLYSEELVSNYIQTVSGKFQ